MTFEMNETTKKKFVKLGDSFWVRVDSILYVEGVIEGDSKHVLIGLSGRTDDAVQIFDETVESVFKKCFGVSVDEEEK